MLWNPHEKCPRKRWRAIQNIEIGFWTPWINLKKWTVLFLFTGTHTFVGKKVNFMCTNCFVFSCTLGLALCQNALSAILSGLRDSLMRQEMIGLMVKSEAKYGIPGKKVCKYIPHSNTFQALGYLRAPQKCVNTEKWGWVGFLWWCTKLSLSGVGEG